MYYTIYKTTNLLNGKTYIGKHATNDPNDKYFGSGVAITRAISKYGVENFIKDILFIFDTEDEMNDKERELITQDMIDSQNTYNNSLGGQGGRIVLYPDHPLYYEVCRKISDAKLEKSDFYRELAIENHKHKKIGMYGKRQSDKQKAAVGKMARERIRTAEESILRVESFKKTMSTEGYIHPNKGRKRPDAAESLKKMPKKTCEYCMKTMNAGNYGRYHGQKCKHNA